MPAIYHSNVITTIPYYDSGRINHSANVLHWQGSFSSNLTPAQLASIQSTFNNAWSVGWLTFASDNVKYLGCWVIDMSNSQGGQITNADYIPVAGSVVNPPVADNVAALISLRGTLRYKGGHSRVYIPGLAASLVQSDGSTVVNTAVDDLNLLWTQTVGAMAGITSVNGGPFTPIIWHKKLASAPDTIEAVSTHISQNILASQRRRLRKVSRHKKKVTTP